MIDEVRHGEEDEDRNEAAREDDIFASADVLHHDPFLGDEQSSLVMGALRVGLGATLRVAPVLLQPSHEVGVCELVEEEVEDELLARDDAEDVHKLLGIVADEAAQNAAVDVWGEDGEVHVRVGVGGVKEAEERDRVGRSPELEDLVNVQQVLVERPMLVQALARPARMQDLQQPGEARIHLLVLIAQKWPALRQLGVDRRSGIGGLPHSGTNARRRGRTISENKRLRITRSSPACTGSTPFLNEACGRASLKPLQARWPRLLSPPPPPWSPR